MRPHQDQAAGVIIIPDPTQTALSAAIVVAWRVFVKILSVEHDVYLQVLNARERNTPHTYTLM